MIRTGEGAKVWNAELGALHARKLTVALGFATPTIFAAERDARSLPPWFLTHWV